MSYVQGLAGGALIGAASALLLLTHGRVAGISGITSGTLINRGAERHWRVAFVAGLVLAGLGAAAFAPQAISSSPRSLVVVAIAGLLVGVGTRMGNGCTSGHGVCGLSRGSRRSFVAVLTFMATAAITATIAGKLS